MIGLGFCEKLFLEDRVLFEEHDFACPSIDTVLWARAICYDVPISVTEAEVVFTVYKDAFIEG